MRTSNQKQNTGFSDPEWYFLGEYPLCVLMADLNRRGSPKAELLFQTIRELGVHAELLNTIERKLLECATEATAKLNKGNYEAPAYFRLFCQKKTMEGIKSISSKNQFKAEQTIKSTKIIRHSDPEINGGWGYFLIESGGGLLPNSSECRNYWVDLYLYKEGE